MATMKVLQKTGYEVTALLLLLAACGHVVKSDCIFPDFLQTPGDYLMWLYNLTEAGTGNWNTRIHYINVKAGVMSVQIEGSGTYKRSCLQKMDDDVFLVSYEEPGAMPKFTCIQFIKRSPAVISINISPYGDEEDPNLCSDMDPDDRPLVLYPGDYYENCPPLGGYNMQVYDQHDHKKCRDKLETPRLESDCHDTSYMYFDFKDCFVKKIVLGMRGGFTRKLFCTGSWTEGPYTFVLLARQDLANYWCFRYPTNRGDSFDAYLFSDVVCERNEVISESQTYARLTLTRQVVLSTCEDSTMFCDLREDEYKCGKEGENTIGDYYCKRKCSICDREAISPCEFMTPNVTWRTFSELQSIEFNTTYVSLHSMGDLVCLGQITPSKIQVLVKYQDNGCFPQTYCLSLKQITETLMVYRLYQGPLWPHFTMDTIVCSDRDAYNQDFRYFARHWTPSVTGEELKSIPCGIPDESYTFHAKYSDGTTCQGSFHKPDCKKSSSSNLVIDSTSCSVHHKVRALRYTCLGEIPNHSAEGKFLLVREWGPGKHRFFCFYFNYQFTMLRILPGDKCYSHARHAYQIGEFQLHQDVVNPCRTRKAEDAQIMAEVNAEATRDNSTDRKTKSIFLQKSNDLWDIFKSGSERLSSCSICMLVIFAIFAV